MTELLLICAVGALGVTFATTVARWLRTRPAHDPDLARSATLVNGGVTRFLKRQTVVCAAVAAVAGALVFLAYGVAYQTETVTGVSPREFGTWATVSYLTGAALALIAEWVAAWASRHASVRVAVGARRSLDESLQIAIRAGAVPGVIVPALAAIGLAALFLGMLAMAGGLGPDAHAAFAKATRFPLLLAGFALGAAFIALMGQLGGGIFGKVADIGADVAGKLEASLPEDSPDNPAVVADLVGDSVGDGSACAAGVLAAAACEALAAMLAAAMVYRHNPDLPSVTAFVLYPLVARVFGLLAAWFGVFVVRTDDTEAPMNALARGLYVTTLLYAVGAVGCAKWLLGSHWMALGGCAAIGAAASLVFLAAAQYYSEQRYRPVRTLAEAARGGPTLVTLRGLYLATESAGALLIVTVATAFGTYYLGASTGLADGGLLGLAIGVGGMLGSAPYVLAMVSLGTITDTAGGLIDMTASERPDVRARARLLDGMGATAKCFARSLSTVASSLASFLLATLFLREVWEATGSAHADVIDVTRPSLYIGGMLGLLVLLAFVGTVIVRVVSAARELVNELRVQLAPLAGRNSLDPSEVDPVANPGDTPHVVDDSVDSEPLYPPPPPPRPPLEAGQLACVEIVSRIALRGMLAPVLVGVGLPLLVGVALRLMATGDRVTTSAEAIVALLFVATIAGALCSLLFSNAGSAWDNAKKYIETGAHGGRYLADGAVDNPTYTAAVVADTIGDPLKGAVGPATQALVKTLATLALVFLPFFL